MSKPTMQDKIKAIDIVCALIDDVVSDENWDETDGVYLEMRRIYSQLERRKQALLAPPQPTQPRKPKAVSRVQETDTPPTQVTVATYTPDTSNLNRVGRNGRAK